jgi:hypothetical protein
MKSIELLRNASNDFARLNRTMEKLRPTSSDKYFSKVGRMFSRSVLSDAVMITPMYEVRNDVGSAKTSATATENTKAKRSMRKAGRKYRDNSVLDKNNFTAAARVFVCPHRTKKVLRLVG